MTNDANRVGLKSNLRRRQALAACEVVLEIVMGAGNYAVFDFAFIER